LNIINTKEINNVLTSADRKSILFFVPFFIINVLLESVSIGLIVPLISALTNVDYLIESASTIIDVSDYSVINIQLSAIALFGLIFILKSSYSLYLFYYVESVYVEMRNRLHKQIYGGYLRASLLFHKEHNTSEIKRNVDEVGMVFQQYLSPLVILISEVSVVFGLVAVLFYVNSVLSLFSFAFILLIVVIVYKLFKPKLRKLGVVRIDAAERTNRHMFQGLFAIIEIKLKLKENYFTDKFSGCMHTYLKTNMMNALYNLASSVFVEILFVMGILLILTAMLLHGTEGKEILPVLALFALTSIRILSSVKKITVCLNQLAYSEESISLVSSEINYLKSNNLWDNNDDYDREEEFNFVNDLKLDGLSFKYPSSEDFALKDIDLNIKKGQCIGIVGHSGSGKTTIINVLLGLLKPTAGNYYIDGIQGHKIHHISHLIGYVPQKIYILDDTIVKNVAFGCHTDEIDLERVVVSLKMAHIYNDLISLANGLDTILGENGATLSGGQIQRIGIARALYDDPEILVFDEATSSLDNLTESIINSEIESLSNLKTIIVIAHRLSSVKRCDNIYYMEQGEIAAVGTFNELYDKSISFKTLVDVGTLV